MHPRLHPLEQLHQLDDALRLSALRPLVLFKHSRTCGTSAQALDELLEHLDQSTADAHYAMVTVQTHREISTLIAQRLGVRHETPQVLLLRDGRVVWHASHFRVTAAAIAAALESQAAAVR